MTSTHTYLRRNLALALGLSLCAAGSAGISPAAAAAPPAEVSSFPGDLRYFGSADPETVTVVRAPTSVTFTVTGTTIAVSPFNPGGCTTAGTTATCPVTPTTFVYVGGGDGDDTIIGSTGHDDYLDGGNGDDTIFGNGGNDGRITGDGSQNFGGLEGNEGDDKLYGGAGDDLLNGGPGSDQVYGEIGDDAVNGGDGVDLVSGGDGDDALHVMDQQHQSFAADGDTFDGGNGNDTVTYVNRLVPVTVTANDATANDGIAGENDNVGATVENIVGGRVGDVLWGNAGPNELIGGGGNDDLHGLAGSDGLFGGDGNDTIIGGTGVDELRGQRGDDAIVSYDLGSDAVGCGAGADTVRADLTLLGINLFGETIDGDCETRQIGLGPIPS